jgi:glutaredoxin
MASDKELVIYGRTSYCPYLDTARDVLAEYHVPHRVIMIDQDEAAARRVVEWTGFRSVPTLIVAERGSDLPYQEPEPLSPGASPRGVDRGSMITEANADELVPWLRRHELISS